VRVLLAAGEGGDDTVVKGRPNTENGTEVAAVGTHVFSFSDFYIRFANLCWLLQCKHTTPVDNICRERRENV